MKPNFHSPSQIVFEDIPMVFRIFFRDLNILLHRPVALIILLGVAVLPSLYAWVNIYANWDPYGNTGNLKVAVASADAGYKVEGMDMNMGDSVISSLHENDSFDWQFTDEADARDGVESGKYYAAVIIPESFSKDIITFVTDGAERPSIEYYSNEKKNAIAAKITTTGMSTLRSTINEQFINTVSATVLDVLNMTDTAITEKGDNIVDSLTGNLETTKKDLDDFSTAIDALISTARSAQSLTDAAQALLPDLDSTVSSNISALEDLRLLVKSADNTGDALTDALDTNMDAIFSTCEGLYDNLLNMADDIDTMAGDGADALENISDTAGTAADNVRDLRDYLSSNESKFLEMAHQLDQVLEDLKQLPLPTPSILENESGVLESALKTAIDGQISTLDQLYRDLRDISRDTLKAADTLRADGALPAADLKVLRTDLKNLRADLRAVQDQYQTEVSPRIDDTLNQFYVCLDSLSDILLTTNQNLPLLGNVLTGVNDSLEHSISALESTKTLLGNAEVDIDKLLDDLNSVEKDERFAKLLDIIRDDPQTVSNFLSSPVELTTTHVFPVKNYGSSMTPFYSILAIWVGALLMGSIVKTNVMKDEKIRTFGPTVAYFGRYCLFGLVGAMQGVIICLGDLYILHIQCLYPGKFILVGLVAGLVYSLMTYTLIASFNDVGKAISVVILVVQVAGSGGTFPVELLPNFFQTMNPYMPFTFCITAMRECIGGMYGNTYAVNLITVSAIYVPISLLLGVVLRRPIIQLMHFFEHQVEKTGLM